MTIPTTSIEGIGLGPVSDTAALPPLDGLLAQNTQATADFQAAVEQFQLAMEGLPSPAAETPAEVPVAGVPVAEVPAKGVPAAEVPVKGAPVVDAKNLPPLDDLLAQNERVVTDFEATAEKLQVVMKELPLPKVTKPEDPVDGMDVAAPQALPVVEVVLPARTEQVDAADGVSAVRGVEAVRPVEAVGSQELIEIAEAVADRVLVSPGLMQGDGEVRVLLKPDVLQGTEIRVVSESGTVTVNFIPATPEIAALLERNQPLLVQHLATHVPSVRLGVSVGRNLRNRENV